jgi:hypothetical protein
VPIAGETTSHFYAEVIGICEGLSAASRIASPSRTRRAGMYGPGWSDDSSFLRVWSTTCPDRDAGIDGPNGAD